MRASGILLHISSLPSPHGIGTMGAAAKDFAVELLTNDNSCGTLMIVKLLFYYNFTFDFWFAE